MKRQMRTIRAGLDDDVIVLRRFAGPGNPVRRRFSGFGPKPASDGFAVGTPVERDFRPGKVGAKK